jgi:hypothetical protein
MVRAYDWTGHVVGRLTVEYRILPQPSAKSAPIWLCRCACGNTTRVTSGSLKSGNTRSCGCLGRETSSTRWKQRWATVGLNGRMKHGWIGRHEHNAWTAMIHRCVNPRNKQWHRYGGRGIYVCERWLHSFINFLRDMGPCPPGGTLDRIDNDGPYEPGNCRWVSMRVQGNNRGTNRRLTFGGKTLTIADWEREMGYPRAIIKNRLAVGWSIERAITERPLPRVKRNAGPDPTVPASSSHRAP